VWYNPSFTYLERKKKKNPYFTIRNPKNLLAPKIRTSNLTNGGFTLKSHNKPRFALKSHLFSGIVRIHSFTKIIKYFSSCRSESKISLWHFVWLLLFCVIKSMSLLIVKVFFFGSGPARLSKIFPLSQFP
jgi:hypothetical protein